MAFTYDGLAGVDTMSFGTSPRSWYTITQASDGAVYVDSVSGASDVLKAKLYNVEKLKFNNEQDLIDLATYFQAPVNPTVSVTGTDQNELLSVTTPSAKVDGLAGIAVEVNSETDFVARNPEFQEMVAGIAKVALAVGDDVDTIKGAVYPGGGSVEDKIAHTV
eukprot:gene61201-81587_t